MELIFDSLREFGLGNVIIVVSLFGAGVFVWRGVWPFFVKEAWPEIKLHRVYQRSVAKERADKLTQLYDVLIQVNKDSIKSNAQHAAAITEFGVVLKETIRIIETQSNIRHDELVSAIQSLTQTMEQYTDAANAVVNQWQKALSSIPPFIEERRTEDKKFHGPDRRRVKQ